MYKLLEAFPDVKLDVASARLIRAGVPTPTNYTREAEAALAAASSFRRRPATSVMNGGSMKKHSSFLLSPVLALCASVASFAAPAPKTAPLKTVNLGSAASFAVLAGSEVTNTGKTVITGDLGIYPAAGTFVTGFSGENAASNCCGIVKGQMQDNDTLTETSAAQHAQASLTIAFNDAAGRPCTPCTLENGANLAGSTLTPGLYKSNSTVSIVGGTLFLKGKGVYIFQIATGLTVGVGARVVLESGAQAADVFWQVGTQATLNSGVAFEGTIMAGSAITMGTGSTLGGRALAKTAVTFISDTVTRP